MKYSIMLLFFFLPKLCFSLGHVVSYQEMKENLFGSITHLETCGAWDDSKYGGEFRLMKVFYAGQDMLFVDMIHISEDQTSFDIEYGFTFSEINNDHAELLIEEVNCHSDSDNKIVLTIKASNQEDKIIEFMLLIDGKNQSYQYQELTK